jgi:hypothetical protein
MEKQTVSNKDFDSNPAAIYAAARNALYKKGKKVEILANFNNKLMYLAEWWKQLYGESEGKENKGIFPASVNFTADLHSMGQYIQEGERILMETVISVKNPDNEVLVPLDPTNADTLNFLANKRDRLYQSHGRARNHVGTRGWWCTQHSHRDSGLKRVLRGTTHVFFRDCLCDKRLYPRGKPLRPTWRGSLQEKHVRFARETRIRGGHEKNQRKVESINSTGCGGITLSQPLFFSVHKRATLTLTLHAHLLDKLVDNIAQVGLTNFL